MKDISIILLLLSLLSCNTSDNKTSIKVTGSWEFFAEGIDGKKEKPNRTNEITFKSDGSYTQSIWNDDVGNTFKGMYFINTNPKRGYSTLTLIPDLIKENQDSIFTQQQNWDIVNITLDELVVQEPTQWIKRVDMDGKSYTINKRNYFKKK